MKDRQISFIAFKGNMVAGRGVAKKVFLIMAIVSLTMGCWFSGSPERLRLLDPHADCSALCCSQRQQVFSGAVSAGIFAGPFFMQTPKFSRDTGLSKETAVYWMRFGLELGIVTTLCLYCLIMFASLRERSFLWCFLSVLFLGIFFVVVHPLPRKFFADVPAAGGCQFAWMTLGAVVIALGCFFRSFLRSAAGISALPTVDRLSLVLIGQGGFLILLGGVFAGTCEAAGMLAVGLAMTCLPVMAAASLIAWHKGVRRARFLFGASVFTGAGSIAQVLFLTGRLPHSPELTCLFEAGCAGGGLLLICALGDRIRALQRDREILRISERRHMLLAFTDALTGLFNMRYFRTQLEAEILSAEQLKQSFVLMMMDIDNFKLFNDCYGHLAGDRVLRQLGRFINQAIREKDVACRYGGEEFAVILPGSDFSGAIDIHTRLQSALRQWAEQKEEALPHVVTLSVGVAEYLPGEKADSLIARADAAMYAAKEGGRNQLVLSEYSACDKERACKSSCMRC